MLKRAEVHGKERHKPCGTKNLMSVFQSLPPRELTYLGPAVAEEGSSKALWFGEILWSSTDQGSKALQQKQFCLKSSAVSISVSP